jgi:hypothetical protein
MNEAEDEPAAKSDEAGSGEDAAEVAAAEGEPAAEPAETGPTTDETETEEESVTESPAPAGTAERREAPKDVIGRYSPVDTVLVRYDPDTSQWSRLAPQEPLGGADRLRSLPTFRPTLSLSNGMNLVLVGETEVTLHGAEGPDSRPPASG